MLMKNETLKVLVCGSNGYIGHYLCKKLRDLGHDVVGLDNLSKVRQLYHFGFESAIPFKENLDYLEDLKNYQSIRSILSIEKPDVIFNLAQQPAPTYSMLGFSQSAETQVNNVVGALSLYWAVKETNPEVPIIQIGTLGEFGYSKMGRVEDGLSFVDQARMADSSLYHLSKNMMTLNAIYLSKIWGLKIVDIQQTVVEGARENNPLYMDWVFGTVCNRIMCQAIVGEILRYGSGNQRRSLLSLEDSVWALITVMRNIDEVEGYLSVNQFDPDSILSCNEIIEIVLDIAGEYNIEPKVKTIPNPRIEREDNEPDIEFEILPSWGFTPLKTVEREIRDSFPLLLEHKDRIQRYAHTIEPKPVMGWQRR